ncbi:YARHG domain-containing protein [Aurantimonas marianensis]|uniref:YARHG domain-containing protein n=1 Tax=Aurantimonas marianensis TaxID=2920428 RepID=A0A9X2H408_9HYPH|nr:YARHG domain-containing protein [Aurantimonas marianensis]MCP3055230.1 YARHG domain-containing protein [Aurantimonas marianensis]
MIRRIARRFLTTLFPAVAGLSPAVAQNDRDLSCDELWYARNAIYADPGYCFEARRAQRVFGRNCFPPYGPLPASDERGVAAIQHRERRYGCR